LALAGCPTWKSDGNFPSKIHRAKRVKRLDILLAIEGARAERHSLSRLTIGGNFVEMITEALPVILARGEGDTLHAFGEEVIVHLAGAQTGGKIALWTEITPPGGGPPPHYHLNEDELFFV